MYYRLGERVGYYKQVDDSAMAKRPGDDHNRRTHTISYILTYLLIYGQFTLGGLSLCNYYLHVSDNYFCNITINLRLVLVIKAASKYH